MTKYTVDFKLYCYMPINVEADTPEEAEQKAEIIATNIWDDLCEQNSGVVGFDELTHLQTMLTGEDDGTEIVPLSNVVKFRRAAR